MLIPSKNAFLSWIPNGKRLSGNDQNGCKNEWEDETTPDMDQWFIKTANNAMRVPHASHQVDPKAT